MKVSPNPCMPDLIPTEAIELVQGLPCVPCLIRSPQRGVEEKMPCWLHSHPKAHSLVQQFIHQPCTHQLRGRCRHVAKIVVIEIERNPLMRLVMHSKIASAQAGSGRDAIGSQALGCIHDKGVIDRNGSLVEQSVLEEQEWAVQFPLQRVDRYARGAR